jgi:hypothetical protein
MCPFASTFSDDSQDGLVTLLIAGASSTSSTCADASADWLIVVSLWILSFSSTSADADAGASSFLLSPLVSSFSRPLLPMPLRSPSCLGQ